MLSKVTGKLKRLIAPGTMTALDQLQQRNEQLIERIRDLELQQVDSLTREADQNRQIAAWESDTKRRVIAAVSNLIRRSSPEAYFDCEFNGVHALLPRDTLRTMTHCIDPAAQGPLRVAVEIYHQNWLKEKLRSGDLFLDVGAATGAMTIPIAKSDFDVNIIAFEPNRNTRRILLETLERNGIARVEVEAFAVSDTVGVATFIEMPNDPTGNWPFMPETSSIHTEMLSQFGLGTNYQASVTTLDAYFAERTDALQVRAIKIDVEGFEVHVLRGANLFLQSVRPYMAIDIHQDPFATSTTESGVRAILTPFGYSFEKLAHVLLCTPSA